MLAIESTRARWTRITHSISAKLVLSLVLSMSAVFGLLGYLIVRLHQQHLEQTTLASAERVSDVIRRSTTFYMLRNDRDGLYHAIQTIADEPGMLRVRILDNDGRVNYSTASSEVGHIVDKDEEACYVCHSQSQPLAHLNKPDRFRIYRDSGGLRVLGIITPIENQSGCSNAACHAHPANQRVLGVLDVDLSLESADAQLAQTTRRMLGYLFCALVSIGVMSWLFVWQVVGKPIKTLKDATERLSHGGLGYQIDIGGQDELGDLERSFNRMSSQLQEANNEIVAWTKTLEDRVDQKTGELKRASEHLLHVEKMASLGKMAAVVAHEVNNPLSGILTYAKLLRKWIGTGQAADEKRDEAVQCLELIAGESRRCGELVNSLLSLSRTAPMNLELVDLHAIVDRCLLLVRHPLEMAGVQLQLQLADDLPQLQCDPAQIEQVLLALITNAMDALPQGGNIWLQAQFNESQEELEIQVRDDGPGIAPDLLTKIFEPFFTTKDNGRGVGLGLAISRGIVERHRGRIQVDSELGKGTIFTITLPVSENVAVLMGATAGSTTAVTK
jgi:two-component system, NtrC family, sensor kinase